MPSFVVRFSAPAALRRFGDETLATHSCFVATDAEIDMGEQVELEVVSGTRRLSLPVEVSGLEVNAEGQAGLRLGLDDAARTHLGDFVDAVAGPMPPMLDDELPTNPELHALGPVPIDAPPTLRVPTANPVPLDASPPAATDAKPAVARPAARPPGTSPGAPPHPSGPTATRSSAPSTVRLGAAPVHPAPPPVRIDAAHPVPSAPRQSSGPTPATAPIRIDAARPVASAPPQSSGQTPGRIDAPGLRPALPSQPRVRIDAAPTQAPPSAPHQPVLRIDAQPAEVPSARAVSSSPSRPGLRIDAQPTGEPTVQPFSSSPSQPGLRIDAQPIHHPSNEPATQPPSSSPSQPGLRIDAQPIHHPSNEPATQPPSSSPSQPGLRIDAARPVPNTPRQPSPQTPARPDAPPQPVVDAARPVPSAPRQASIQTPPRASAPPTTPTGRPPVARTPSGSIGLAPVFSPSTPGGHTAPDGRVGRLSELNAALGFPLTPERLAHAEKGRARLPEVMPIAWLVGVEFVRSADPRAFPTLLSLCVDVAVPLGGALDVFSPASATFVFFGLGSQANAVLAAAEIRERLELLADGRPDAPTLKLGLTGTRLRADPDVPVDGDGVQSVKALLRRAAPGQCHAARNLAHGVSDLVEWAPANDDVRLVGRRPAPIHPPASVGLDPLLRLLDTRVSGLERGAVAPVVVAGPRRSGRTHLSLEFARRAHAQGCLVARTTSLRGEGAPLSAVVELLCQAAQVPWEERHAALGPALEQLHVATERRHAALVLAGLEPSPVPFTPRQVTDALRLTLADLADGRRRVLIFDGLDHADAASLEVFRELSQTPQPRELLVGLASTELAGWFGLEQSFTVPTLTLAEVEALLQASLGTSPHELRDLLLARSNGYPGSVMELLMLTASRGGLRPRGETLTLEGTVPMVTPEDLPRARLLAEGTRVARLLEVLWLLGERAEGPTVARVLPEVMQAAWPRAVAARLMTGQEGRAVVAPDFEALLAGFSGNPTVAARCAAALGATGPDTVARAARIAWLLERANEPQRAGAQWKLVAERAVAAKDVSLAASAHEGLARALERHPQKESDAILALRLSSWARATCAHLARRDVEAAARAIDEGRAALPPGRPPEAELSLATVRVRRAQGRLDEATEALAEALAASKGLPMLAAVLAEQAELLEAAGDTLRAEAAWHQALASADAFAPLGPWLSEVDFRARVESRIGALFIGRQQHGRARTWLLSSAERFLAAEAPLFASRVQANLGALAAQSASWSDAAIWFRQAAATAEAGGDFLFQARQLAFLAKALARVSDPSAQEVAAHAGDLAQALDWPEGAAAMQALR